MTSNPSTAASQGREARLFRRGVWLEYATLGWNVVEIGFLVMAAIAARSVALTGFAIDSFIEIFASLVVLWHLRGIPAERERHAVRLIGVAFFGLAVFIAGQIAVTLAAGIRPDSSPLGVAWLSATCVVMLLLAAGKARVGALTGNEAFATEARVTLIDGLLAAGILTGLLLNALIGWWWADVAAGVILIAYGLYEGIHAVREQAASPGNRADQYHARP